MTSRWYKVYKQETNNEWTTEQEVLVRLYLDPFSNYAPALRRQNNLLSLYRKILEMDEVLLNRDIALPRIERLKSRKPAISTAKFLSVTDFNPKEVWKESWSSNGIGNALFDFETHTSKSKEFCLPRKIWCNLNRLRTGHGRCNDMLYKWKMVNSPSCECGSERLTMSHILNECPIYKYDDQVETIPVESCCH